MQRIKKMLQSSADTEYENVHQLFLHDRADEAEQEAQKLIKKYPTHTSTYFLLAQIAWNDRHYQRAREWYNKILSYEKNNSKALL